jgi:hypothetical protein
MAKRGITHIRLGLDGRIAVVRWQEVGAAGMPTGPAQEATVESMAAAINEGDVVTFWSPLQGGQRTSGGEVQVELSPDGKLRLVVVRAGSRRLEDLPRF